MTRSVSRLISILYRKNQVYLTQALKALDISPTEMTTLLSLYQKQGVTQDDISHYLLIDKASIARAISTLLEKGFITKEKDDTDKRANRIYLTKKGQSIEKDIHTVLQLWNQILLTDIDQNDVETTFHVLEKMVSKLEKTEGVSHEQSNK